MSSSHSNRQEDQQQDLTSISQNKSEEHDVDYE